MLGLLVQAAARCLLAGIRNLMPWVFVCAAFAIVVESMGLAIWPRQANTGTRFLVFLDTW